MTDIESAKKELRRQLRLKWLTLDDAQRRAMSAAAVELLRSRPEWKQARKVMLFAPLKDELDVWPLVLEAVESKDVVALPRFDPMSNMYTSAVVNDPTKDIVLGFMGIREPAVHCRSLPFSEFDFVLVPGVGFDRAGARLGRGLGYYDRILTQVRCRSCGVAMDWQVLPSIPTSRNDKPVDFIVTPTQWIQCARSASNG